MSSDCSKGASNSNSGKISTSITDRGGGSSSSSSSGMNKSRTLDGGIGGGGGGGGHIFRSSSRSSCSSMKEKYLPLLKTCDHSKESSRGSSDVSSSSFTATTTVATTSTTTTSSIMTTPGTTGSSPTASRPSTTTTEGTKNGSSASSSSRTATAASSGSGSGSGSTSSSVSSSSKGRGTTQSFSGFLHEVDLDSDDVVDPRTGKYIFNPSTKSDSSDLSDVAEELAISVGEGKGGDEPLRPSLAEVREGLPTPKKRVSGTERVRIESARSSMKSSRTFQSTARGLKRVKRSALLILKIGKLVINRGIVAPVAREAVRDWKSLHSFRARGRAERRSKTLDWFEDRAKATKRAKEMEQQRQQTKRRNLWRNHLEKERAVKQTRDVLNEIRALFKKMADAKYAASLEQERIRNFFLGSNDGWKMQTLTKRIEEEEHRRRRQKGDAEAESVREGEKRRQAAAAEYLAEYDRSEVAIQASLRIMRRAGFIPGVNASPVTVEEAPLETESFLLLRLKSGPHPIGGEVKKSQGSGSASNLSPDRTTGASLLEAKRQSAELSLSAGEQKHPLPSPEVSAGPSSRAVTAASGSRSVAERGSENNPQQHRSSARASGDNGGGKSRGGQNRGRKQSSGAFEVDLLRFRSVEEIRGWKLGAPGGESLAADFSNGACPRLKILRLGWCSLGDRGTRAIVRALGRGGTVATGKTLQELQLRGNAITAGRGSTVWKALSTGALPALRALDLGNNSLGDVGGRAVAHNLLAGRGTWPRLVILDLSGNEMRDRGVEAVFKAVTAPGVALAYEVEYINLRFNRLSRAARERTASAPGFLVI